MTNICTMLVHSIRYIAWLTVAFVRESEDGSFSGGKNFSCYLPLIVRVALFTPSNVFQTGCTPPPPFYVNMRTCHIVHPPRFSPHVFLLFFNVVFSETGIHKLFVRGPRKEGRLLTKWGTDTVNAIHKEDRSYLFVDNYKSFLQSRTIFFVLIILTSFARMSRFDLLDFICMSTVLWHHR